MPERTPEAIVAENMKRLRESQNLSIEELATRTGLSVDYLVRLESKQLTPEETTQIRAEVAHERAEDQQRGAAEPTTDGP